MKALINEYANSTKRLHTPIQVRKETQIVVKREERQLIARHSSWRKQEHINHQKWRI